MALVAKVKYCADTGIPETTLRGWIDRHLEPGKHYVVHGRTTLVDPEAIEQWLRESAAYPEDGNSDSTTGRKRTAKRWSPRTLKLA